MSINGRPKPHKKHSTSAPHRNQKSRQSLTMKKIFSWIEKTNDVNLHGIKLILLLSFHFFLFIFFSYHFTPTCFSTFTACLCFTSFSHLKFLSCHVISILFIYPIFLTYCFRFVLSMHFAVAYMKAADSIITLNLALIKRLKKMIQKVPFLTNILTFFKRFFMPTQMHGKIECIT